MCKKKRSCKKNKGGHPPNYGIKSTVIKVKQRVGNNIPTSTVNKPYRFSPDYKNQRANSVKAASNYRTRYVTPYTTSKHLSHYRKRDLIHPPIQDT